VLRAGPDVSVPITYSGKSVYQRIRAGDETFLGPGIAVRPLGCAPHPMQGRRDV